MKLSMKQKQNQRHREQTSDCQGGELPSKCKLLYREWINNKVLLYSTDDYIQYPMINHNGKEYL